MSAYIIVYREMPVRDEVSSAQYSRLDQENAADFQAQFGIRPLVLYGKSEAPECTNPDGVVLLEFPTYDAAKAWYESPAYQEALAFRKNAAEWRAVIVEGLPINH